MNFGQARIPWFYSFPPPRKKSGRKAASLFLSSAKTFAAANLLQLYAKGEITATYTDLNFPYELVKADDLSATVLTNAEQTCRDAGITDPILLEDCILDVGVTGDAAFADNMTDLTPPEQSITVTDGMIFIMLPELPPEGTRLRTVPTVSALK